MQIIMRAADLHTRVGQFVREGRRIGLVPTMGNLHRGHSSLVRLARQHADVVIASVFVNPIQFAPHEDFSSYPRTPEADAKQLAEEGCDVLFLPGVEEMYPDGTQDSTRISVPMLTDQLEGALRPGHFDGVASVVAKLFNTARPDVALFGQKDYQQLLVIRQMTRDLCYPIAIVAAPIVRETNGLAMSSRNQYLTRAEREQASAIHTTLQWMAEQMRTSMVPPETIARKAMVRLQAAGLTPDYTVIRKAADLTVADATLRCGLIALVAARIGRTRLIDNLLIDP